MEVYGGQLVNTLDNAEFKFHCNLCEFQALEEDILKEHSEAFHQPKFSCRKCFQTFSQQDELIQHIETHEEMV